MKIPDHYLPVMPYLILKDANGFLSFAKSVFNATEQMIVPGPKGDARKIMHGEIKIGDAVIMFASANEQWNEKTSGMFLYVDDVDSIMAKAQQYQSEVLARPAMQEYGYSAGFNDPYGNQWWITNMEE